MGNPNNGNQGQGKLNHGSQQHNDKQKNYAHSNERNRDNIRDNTRDHTYKDHDQTLTNDQNYNLYNDKIEGDPDFRDTKLNANKDETDNTDK